MSELRKMPSIDYLLNTSNAKDFTTQFGRPLTVDALRVTLDEARAMYVESKFVPDVPEILSSPFHYYPILQA